MSIRLGAVAVDCPDPAALGDFYREVLGLKVVLSTPDLVALEGPGILLSFERVDDHRPPTWPAGPAPKQLHLDLAVDNLDVEESRLLALGATKAELQPNPDKWRVLIDPAGHPFCITVVFRPASA
ncbi:VOC family protein [Mycolicibacterium cosmeticum]|uniref:Glyoxalase/bleomycin resistance protein/dioxygenase n=1 Tax=Mycolicibacterium cosmeticum TaxID=258533 RepID=W9BKP6_MYCCO|nr:VOC family protein [Mycolicibacterium cosmeticum]CDO08265.1 glyoxalase/bleomycin resistance protein/dioxygenase [Mycolicibacterium cosmeticum]